MTPLDQVVSDIRAEHRAQLARRYQELRYRMVECAMTLDHPTTKANRQRWANEFRQVEAACERLGMLS